jgi:exodeoxyribonuclease V alpha subunit
MPQTIEQALERLSKSKFRSGFGLSRRDLAYIAEKGLSRIQEHAADFVHRRLAAATPENDGRQTPFSGHPVFKAQHATACCCRGCLNKWYRVPLGVPLTPEQEAKIVALVMAWIRGELAEKQHLSRANLEKGIIIGASD